MTIEEAKEYIPDFDSFCSWTCYYCEQEWYCPAYCDLLEKAERIDFNRILECYARNNGDIEKVWRWLKQARI